MQSSTISLRWLGALLLLGIAQPALAQRQETAVPAPGMGGVGSGPNGATLRCKDGSYPAPGAADAACDGKGGVLVRFPARRTPQPPAAVSAPTRPPAVRAAPRDTTPPAGFVPWRERRARAAEESAQQRMPEGATLRCSDGTWVVRDTTSVRCASHGGVQLRIAPAMRPPRPRGG